jgi:hypothetical protein
MHHRFLPLAGLAALAMLLAGPAPALASGEPLQQTVDGYTLTLALPAQGLVTGQNSIAVTLRDSQGNAPAATVSAALLAFSPAAEGHSRAADDHGATNTQAPADDHGREDGAAPSAEAEYDHDAAGALEGQGIAAAPVALAAASERGAY